MIDLSQAPSHGDYLQAHADYQQEVASSGPYSAASKTKRKAARNKMRDCYTEIGRSDIAESI